MPHVPPPYRYMPDREVEGRVAAGVAETWSASAGATLVRRGAFVIDHGALLGLDEGTRRRVIEYVGAVADRIGEASAAASFQQWVLQEGHWGPESCGGGGQLRQWFPSNFGVRRGEQAPVPIKVLPAPELVRSSAAVRFDRVRTASVEALVEAGVPIGRTLVYEHGALRPDFAEGMANGARLFRVLPRAMPAISRNLSDVVQNSYAPQFGRLVLPNTAEAWAAAGAALHPGGAAGSRVFGEVQTVGLLPEVSLRRILDAEGKPAAEPVIVYELWDGLEGVRCDAPARVDPLMVPVSMEGVGVADQPRLGGHEVFRVPLPLTRGGAYPQERIVVDESWAAAPRPVILVRKGAGWEPYREVLVVSNDAASIAGDNNSLLMVGIFSGIAPEQLVEILSVLAGVDASTITADAEFMGRLEELGR